jgi:hypothetical protein
LREFYGDLLRGEAIKNLIRALLEKSGYLVSPYGYESSFSHITKRLHERGAKNSPTARRLRTSPDLLVYDEEKQDVDLVEVKMRNAPILTSVGFLQLKEYKRFWTDATLVLAVPCGHTLYAEKIRDLEIKKKYNAETDFDRFEHVFRRVDPEDVSAFTPRILSIIKDQPNE